MLPKRYAIYPIITAASYMTMGQRIVIATLDFTIFRIMIFVGWLRVLVRGEARGIKYNEIDKVLITWVIVSFIAGILLDFTAEKAINRCGFAYNALGAYFLFRLLLMDGDFNRLEKLIQFAAIIIFPLSVFMIVEYTTGRNLFSIFGGVREITMMRGDRMRSQGVFAHPILAGTFGATIFPLFLGLWFRKSTSKIYSFIGMISSFVIVATSSSSGPLMSLMFGILAMMMWPLRDNMRIVRWGIAGTLIALHLIMKAPVWYLMARVSELIGGTGWHRAYLVERAIYFINEWYLIGTTNTAHWIPQGTSYNSEMSDITNQFILEGVDGGLFKMILFIAIIGFCFKKVGVVVKKMDNYDKGERIMIWSLGAALFAHVTAFMSVSYFDQMVVFWYLVLAMIASLESMRGNSDVAKARIIDKRVVSSAANKLK